MKALYKAVCLWITADAFSRHRGMTVSVDDRKYRRGATFVPSAVLNEQQREMAEVFRKRAEELNARGNEPGPGRKGRDACEPVTWRSTSAVSVDHRDMAVSFERADGHVVRLLLGVLCAHRLSESIAAYLRDHELRARKSE